MENDRIQPKGSEDGAEANIGADIPTAPRTLEEFIQAVHALQAQPKPAPVRLAQRIVMAMQSVGSIAKSGENKDQHYKYQKAADIFEAAQAAFVEHGICLLADEGMIEWPDPLTTKSGATMFICRVSMEYTLEDVMSGERKIFHSTGVGFDTSDKALNKGKTMAEKYFLKQLLLIGEEEDDADADTPEETQQPACPVCGVVGAIIKGKPEYGGGWLCFQKKGGCGAKFATYPTLREQKKVEDKPAHKRPQSTPKSETASEPAPPPESGSESTGEAIVTDSVEFDQEILDLRDMCEQTKFPGGMAKFLGIFKVNKEVNLSEQDRKKIRETLTRRAALIEKGDIKI
jgi:hypothetical protein